MRDPKERPIPEFGTRKAGAIYVERPGAYAIIRDTRGQVAVVQTPAGLYLPGGGRESREKPEETLSREVREECGIVISDPRYLCTATQYVHALDEGYFAKRCSYYVVESFESTGGATEPDHWTRWLEVPRASAELRLESDRWALTQLSNVSSSQED